MNAHDAIVKKLESHNSDVLHNKADSGLEADKKFTKNLEALKQRFIDVDHPYSKSLFIPFISTG